MLTLTAPTQKDHFFVLVIRDTLEMESRVLVSDPFCLISAILSAVRFAVLRENSFLTTKVLIVN